MKILIFGDIVGRIGRDAVKRVLPELKAAHEPDLIIGNAENLAQGKGITPEVLRDLLDAGIDLFTSGNHVWDKREVFQVFSDAVLSDRLLRPANYPAGAPGEGAKFLTIGTKNVLVLNFLGRVHSKVLTDDPFRCFDELVARNAHRKPSVILVDFHGEATSEKTAFGWHAAGRVSAVWGTHTHVPTRDERILPNGTAYITDVGMSGFRDGVIGVERTPIIKNFMTQLPVQHEIPDTGDAVVNAVVIAVDGTGKATGIEHFQRIVHI